MIWQLNKAIAQAMKGSRILFLTSRITGEIKFQNGGHVLFRSSRDVSDLTDDDVRGPCEASTFASLVDASVIPLNAHKERV